MTAPARPPAAPQKSPQSQSLPEPAPESWGWTRAHRIGLGLLVAALLLLLAVQFARRPLRLTDPLTLIPSPPGSTSLPTRVDPNTATAAELSRIPHIGPKLAEAIVRYRDARQHGVADGIVFSRLEDLDRVPGIGKKLLEQIEPYVDFPEPASDGGGGVPATEAPNR